MRASLSTWDGAPEQAEALAWRGGEGFGVVGHMDSLLCRCANASKPCTASHAPVTAFRHQQSVSCHHWSDQGLNRSERHFRLVPVGTRYASNEEKRSLAFGLDGSKSNSEPSSCPWCALQRRIEAPRS